LSELACAGEFPSSPKRGGEQVERFFMHAVLNEGNESLPYPFNYSNYSFRLDCFKCHEVTVFADSTCRTGTGYGGCADAGLQQAEAR